MARMAGRLPQGPWSSHAPIREAVCTTIARIYFKYIRTFSAIM